MSTVGRLLAVLAAFRPAGAEKISAFSRDLGLLRKYRVLSARTYPSTFLSAAPKQVIYSVKVETIGATGGAREGNPRHCRIFQITSG